MANYLRSIELNFDKAKRELEKCLEAIESGTETGCAVKKNAIEVSQSLRVTDEMAQVFREKPIIFIQTMDIRIMIVNRINAALRALDKVDRTALKAIGTRQIKEK